MKVDEAMETAAAYLAAHGQEQDPLFTSEEVAITLAKEVERLRAELADLKKRYDEEIGYYEDQDPRSMGWVGGNGLP
jgi:hypothetical protein